MILSHLVLFQFWTGAAAFVVTYPSAARLAPDSTLTLASARILKEARPEAEARKFHIQMSGRLS